MTEEKKLELPNDVEIASQTNSRDLVIISIPKMGKGSILGSFTSKYNALVFDLEKGGYEFIDARKISIYPTQDTTLGEAYGNYVKYRNLLLEQKGKYDYLIIDGLSDLDLMASIGGTYLFMDSVMGKTFNRSGGERLKYGDKGFVLIENFLKEGGGYKWTREWFMRQIEIFKQIAPYRLFAAHISDKLIRDSQKDEVMGSEISLTGKLKTIFASKVTSLAKLIADGDKRYLNFEVMNDSIIAGSRNPKLTGKILISEKDKDGNIITYWDKIYN